MTLSGTQYVSAYLVEAVALVIALAFVIVALVRAGRTAVKARLKRDTGLFPVQAREVLRNLSVADRAAVGSALVPVAYVCLSPVAGSLVERNESLAAMTNWIWLIAGLLVPLYVGWQASRIYIAGSAAGAYGPCVPPRLLRKRSYPLVWSVYGAVVLVTAAVTVVNIIAIVTSWESVVRTPFIR